MAELSKIRKNGVDYDIKDAVARAAIEELKQNSTTTETITKTGTIVSLFCKEGQEITVNGDATGIVELVQHGKNFIPPIQDIADESGMTFSVNDDGSVHISGTATKTCYPAIVPLKNPAFLPAGTYTFSTNFPSNVGGAIGFKPIDSSAFAEFTVNDSTSPKRLTLENGATYQCFYTCLNGKTYDHDVWVQVEYGKVATDYEKSVVATTHAIALPSTITAIGGNNVLYTKDGDEVIASIEVPKNGNNNTTTETITKTGVVVAIEADAGAEIKVEADTAEVVELYHTGKNMMPCNVRNATHSGMTVTKQDDGTITFSGIPTTTVYVDTATANDKLYLPAGRYTLEAFNFPVSENVTPVFFTIETVDGSNVIDGGKAITVHGLNRYREFTVSSGAFIKAYYKIVNTFTGAETTCGIMLYMGTKGTGQYEAPAINKVETTLPTTVTAHNGANVLYTTSGDSLTVSTEHSVTTTIVDQFDASDYGLRVLKLDGDCTGMTKDNYVPLAFTFKDKDGNALSGTIEVKKQGSSSINTGVEIGKDFDTDLGGLFNFTLKFPEAFEAKEGWGAQKKYVFKANAIDHSHARNVCSCKLWGQIVKSRANAPTELTSLVNGGAIDGFPIVIVLNGKFYALGTFNIPKEAWMFGSPKAILCADAHVDATKFKALATLDGDFELEYVEDEDNADWVLTSLNRAIQAVMNSNGSDIDSTIGQYIDIPSAIDYYIHTVDENADDGTDKNYILVTFDGIKWYFSAYDRDTVYGLYWNGKSFTSPRGGITFAHYATVHQLMNLIYTYKKSDLKARAVALRDGIKSEINVCDVFTNFGATIPDALLVQNCKRWPLLRSTNASNTAQILNWYRLRRMVIDKELDAM